MNKRQLHIAAIALLMAVVLIDIAWSQSFGGNRGRRSERNGGSSSSMRSNARLDPKYQVIVQRNMFVRDRRAVRSEQTGNGNRDTRPSPPYVAPAPRRPELSFFLRGIALQDGRQVAVIENMDTGKTQVVALGESIAGGRVVRLALDYLEWESGEKRTHVQIGRNLGGETTTTPPATATSSTSTTRPAGSAPTTSPAGPLPAQRPEGMSIEEWMKLRRAQQVGSQ